MFSLRRRPESLPLTLRGPVGALGFRDRTIFDDKLVVNDEYRYNGVKNGVRWKTKLTNYFISRAPLLKEILEWAEEQDNIVIIHDLFLKATSGSLTEKQCLSLDAAIRGFLAGCLHGTAKTMFKRAETLNGLDAWRVMARQVDHGRPVRLETLRREVKVAARLALGERWRHLPTIQGHFCRTGCKGKT